MSDMEYSAFFEFGVKELSDKDGGDAGQFTGHASVFGGPPDLQMDIVAPGAFAATLRRSGGRVPILMGHIMARIVGFGVAAEEDAKGLKVTGQFTLDSDEGRNAYAVAKHAARVSHKLGLSIGYMIPKGGATVDDASGVRTISAIDLLEYSIAAVPACPRARIGAVKGAAGTLREAERYLRQLGMTGDDAREFISVCRLERDANAGATKTTAADQERDANDQANRGAIHSLRLKSLIHEMEKLSHHA